MRFFGNHWSVLYCHNDWGYGGWGRVAVSVEWQRTLDASLSALHRIVLHNDVLSHIPILGECLIGYPCR